MKKLLSIFVVLALVGCAKEVLIEVTIVEKQEGRKVGEGWGSEYLLDGVWLETEYGQRVFYGSSDIGEVGDTFMISSRKINAVIPKERDQ